MRLYVRPATGQGRCEGILAWHVREGRFGEIALDGLNVVGVGGFDGHIWTGEATNSVMGFFMDERADESQREPLQAIFGGQAGGWPAGFSELMDEVLGIEFAPIDFEIADDLAHWRVEVPGKAWGGAEALTGPTTPEGARVQLHNPPGAEVGPGQIATWATVKEHEVKAFGLKWSWPAGPASTSRSTGPGPTSSKPTAAPDRHTPRIPGAAKHANGPAVAHRSAAARPDSVSTDRTPIVTTARRTESARQSVAEQTGRSCPALDRRGRGRGESIQPAI